MKFFYLWLLAKTITCGCGTEYRRYDINKVRSDYKISKVGNLNHSILESSGLEKSSENGYYWTHSDGGGKPTLYQIDSLGVLKREVLIEGVRNIDWEDISQAPDGRLFVGDIGNNLSTRQDLSFLIIPSGWENKQKIDKPDKIEFQYADQRIFTPNIATRKFDSEAFIYAQDSLYVFTKNTSKNPRYTTLYSVPAQSGRYKLIPKDSIRINETITGAALSPDQKQFVLLSYGKFLFFEVNGSSIDFSKPTGCMKRFKGQTEAIVFINNKDFLFTNEKGKVYKATFR